MVREPDMVVYDTQSARAANVFGTGAQNPASHTDVCSMFPNASTKQRKVLARVIFEQPRISCATTSKSSCVLVAKLCGTVGCKHKRAPREDSVSACVYSVLPTHKTQAHVHTWTQTLYNTSTLVFKHVYTVYCT